MPCACDVGGWGVLHECHVLCVWRGGRMSVSCCGPEKVVVQLCVSDGCMLAAFAFAAATAGALRRWRSCALS